MADAVITYETLFDVLRKEKSRDELQQLPSEFYGRVLGYLRQKRGDADMVGGLSSPSAQKPLIQYQNTLKILRELFERRERKILEMALNRARSERNLIDTAPLLAEERRFFDETSAHLRRFRADLLDLLLRGEAPLGVTALDPGIPNRDGLALEDAAPGGEGVPPGSRPSPVAPEVIAAQERCAVRFIAAVPKFLGLSGEIHGPFEPGDTAELPGKVVSVLLKKRRVEIVER